MEAGSSKQRIAIVGGCGHVGIPLGIALAHVGHEVCLVDVNQQAVETINQGRLPFLEEGAETLLPKLIQSGHLRASLNRAQVKEANVVFFVTGTPVDEHHNPRVHDVLSVIDSYADFLDSDKLVVLRSTVYPGVIDLLDHRLSQRFGGCKLAFCPERIVQGKGIDEIFKLPQIVSANSPQALTEAKSLFSSLTPTLIELSPREAELAKLITNSWRYLEFAIANQFYMMVESQGLDFFKIYDALKKEYPRANHFSSPGLAAGPCLFKDTMQLSAFHKNNFFLGQSAMLINEGLPVFLVDQMEAQLGDLKEKTVAILGMTFKPNNDDTRESLSFKVKKLLELRMANVICYDPYLKNEMELKEALQKSDGIILAVPHREFKEIEVSKPFVDCWGAWRRRSL